MFFVLRSFYAITHVSKNVPFSLHLRFASSTIPVLPTYDLELRLMGNTGIARG